jgi:hypothetical protein
MLVATKILHIAFAAAWFGHKLLIPRDVRQSVHDMADGDGLIRRMKRAERLGIGSGLGTLLTGIGLILLSVGFADTPIETYVGLAAVIAMFVVGAAVGRPAWNRIKASIEAGDAPSAAAGIKPFTRALALENLLWILALATMLI